MYFWLLWFLKNPLRGISRSDVGINIVPEIVVNTSFVLTLWLWVELTTYKGSGFIQSNYARSLNWISRQMNFVKIQRRLKQSEGIFETKPGSGTKGGCGPRGVQIFVKTEFSTSPPPTISFRQYPAVKRRSSRGGNDFRDEENSEVWQIDTIGWLPDVLTGIWCGDRGALQTTTSYSTFYIVPMRWIMHNDWFNASIFFIVCFQCRPQ